jgi:hypothetical protein
LAGRGFVEHEEDVDRRRLAGDAGVVERQEEPLEARAEADARGRRPAELLDQAVVATTARNRARRAFLRADELPGRARVVVEAADEGRHELVPDAIAVEQRADGGEVLAAVVAQPIADLRRLLEHRADGRRLGGEIVERAQRAACRLLARVVVEVALVLGEPAAQLLEIRGAARSVADRVELEAVLADAEVPEQRVVEVDDLGVDRRVVGADRLDRQLPVLAEASPLRPAVAEHRPDRVELLRLRLAVEPVLEVGTANRRGGFRAESERAAAAVLERVHLLPHHVRAFAGGPDEEIGVLERRGVDPPVCREGAEALGLRDDFPPERLLRRQDVVCPARRLETRAHEARSSARNGLRAISAPIVVAGPWPG